GSVEQSDLYGRKGNWDPRHLFYARDGEIRMTPSLGKQMVAHCDRNEINRPVHERRRVKPPQSL
ncbi:MAG TPA: hypothetical protein VGC82_10915, partial [Rhodopila sp.]